MATLAPSTPAFAAPTALPSRPRHAPRPATTTAPRPARASAAPPEQPARRSTATDWRAFRAHLAATRRAAVAPSHHGSHARRGASQPAAHWAHAVPLRHGLPEVGSCLVARRDHAWPDSFAHLRRGVVLVTDVDAQRPGGGAVTGLLLTRPTRHSVRTLRAAAARAGAEFGDNAVWLGGDCSTGSLEMLHGFGADVVRGADEIVAGLSRGGLNGARAAVRDAGVSPHRFRFFVAYARWTGDALRAETEAGAWGAVACAPALLLGEGGDADADEDAEVYADALWRTLSVHVG